MFENILNLLSCIKRKYQQSKFLFFLFMIIFVAVFTLMISDSVDVKNKKYFFKYDIDGDNLFNKHVDTFITLLEQTKDNDATLSISENERLNTDDENAQLNIEQLSLNDGNPRFDNDYKAKETNEVTTNDYGEVAQKSIPMFGDERVLSKTAYMLLKTKKDKKKKTKNNLYQQDKPFNFTAKWDEAKISAEENVLRERSKRITEVCTSVQFDKAASYMEPKLDDVTDRMIWVKENNYVWCPIFKAASTTWFSSILRLNGIMPAEGIHMQSLVRELYPRPNNWNDMDFLSKAMKLIIVRHPLDRILSAYRDKMIRRLDMVRDRFQLIQKQINQRFPNIVLPEGMKQDDILPRLQDQPTFNQFLLKVKYDVSNIKKMY